MLSLDPRGCSSDSQLLDYMPFGHLNSFFLLLAFQVTLGWYLVDLDFYVPHIVQAAVLKPCCSCSATVSTLYIELWYSVVSMSA